MPKLVPLWVGRVNTYPLRKFSTSSSQFSNFHPDRFESEAADRLDRDNLVSGIWIRPIGPDPNLGPKTDLDIDNCVGMPTRFPFEWRGSHLRGKTPLQKAPRMGSTPSATESIIAPLSVLLRLLFLHAQSMDTNSILKPWKFEHFRPKSSEIHTPPGHFSRVHLLYSRRSAIKIPQEMDWAVVTFNGGK